MAEDDNNAGLELGEAVMPRRRGKRQAPVSGVSLSNAELIDRIADAANAGSADRIAWSPTRGAARGPSDVVGWIPFESTLLSYAAVNRPDGGFPIGRIVELQGEEQTGKSLLLAKAIARCQAMGGVAALADAENAVDMDYLAHLGVDHDHLLYAQPGTAEKTFEFIELVIKQVRASNTTVPVVIGWDSVSGTPCQAELDGSYDPQERMGIKARVISHGMTKLVKTFGREQISIILTNHLKYKVGKIWGTDPFFVPGGKAIPYYASLRLRVSTAAKIKNDDKRVIGVRMRVKTIKTRFGPPFRECEFDFYFETGTVDDHGSWFDLLKTDGVIAKIPGSASYSLRLQDGSKVTIGTSSEWRPRLASDPEFVRIVAGVLDSHLRFVPKKGAGPIIAPVDDIDDGPDVVDGADL